VPPVCRRTGRASQHTLAQPVALPGTLGQVDGQPDGSGDHPGGPKTPLDWLMIVLTLLAFAVALTTAVLHYASGGP
jgi:hypothetical protein